MKFQDLINTGFPQEIEAKRKRIHHLLSILDEPGPDTQISIDKEAYHRLFKPNSNSNSMEKKSESYNGFNDETEENKFLENEIAMELDDDFELKTKNNSFENESTMIWEIDEKTEDNNEEENEDVPLENELIVENMHLPVVVEKQEKEDKNGDSPIIWEEYTEVVEQSGREEEMVDMPPVESKEEITRNVKTHEEILEKNTNYVFIFGYTGSGKSTVLTAINMYMRRHYRVILNQAGNKDGIRLIHEMMRDIENGSFPQPTSVGTITEYDSAFAINGQDVNLTFLEMAGEDLKRVDVEDGEEGFPDEVKAYLSCPGISISFLIVADYERVMNRTEDRLILQFLSYLYNEGIDLSRVGVILSKFDRDKTDKNIEEVIKEYLPQVDKWLTSDEISHPRVFPFSIGEVASFINQKDQIARINLDDCSELVPWLHQVLSLPGNNKNHQNSGGVVKKLGKLLGWK
ncbi:MAG: hypothetical protein KDD99_09710 [Bacteroidetes bacterium]|nr:hypothetical protein [Bacteroidota bacterium]